MNYCGQIRVTNPSLIEHWAIESRTLTNAMNKPILLFLALGLLPFNASAAGWRALWDGKTLAGWHIIGKGEWRIQDGALHATNVKAEKEFGHLVSDRDYANFTVRLKYKAIKGNSGLYFRVAEQGFSGVKDLS